MPFLSSNGWEFAVKGCLLLGIVNAIYFVRARTEERHLSQDPVYAAYARWIAEHGLLGRLTGRSRRRSTGYSDWRRAAVPVVLCGAAGILAMVGSAAIAQAGAPQHTLMAADAGGARDARAAQSRSDRPQHSDPLPGPDGDGTGSSRGEGARGRAGGGGDGSGGTESGRGR
jgi:hypothetical protein